LHWLYGGECAYRLEEYLAAIRGAGIRLARVLNPFASDINLFPESMVSLKKRLAARLRYPWPGHIPDRLLVVLGRWNAMPGRLYSFVGTKFYGR
jgi:hypothetical protein